MFSDNNAIKLKVKNNKCIFHCCLSNCDRLSSLKQHILIISQFPWVKSSHGLRLQSEQIWYYTLCHNLMARS